MNTERTAAKAAPGTTAAVLTLTLLGALFSSPAGAAPRQGDFTATGVKIHESYSTTSSARGHGNPGDGYTWMGGQANAEAVPCPDGSVKDHWTYIHNNRTGVEGYVSDCFIKEY
ncbi:hypothetical protein ABZZ46_25120 [Streptomyces rochei]|uniref:hypothetical protein n=1 Tax=Streptomyces rochei TaxID=1928 RepID=UPI000A3C13EF|nr:hypothetical protein [Streptomyces rochei]